MSTRIVEDCVLVGITIASEAGRIALHFRDERANPVVHFDVVFWDVLAEHLRGLMNAPEAWYLSERRVPDLVREQWNRFEQNLPSAWPIYEGGGWRTPDELVSQLEERDIRAYEMSGQGHQPDFYGFVLARSMTQVDRSRPWQGIE